MDNPYISFVCASRNDDYIAENISLLAQTITILQFFANKYKLAIEFVLVEWNPILEKPTLADLFDYIEDDTYFTMHIFSVESDFHKKLYHDKINVDHSIALNTGIRRAQGSFITPIASNICYTDEIFKFFAEKELNKDFIYRTIRADVKNCVKDIKDKIYNSEYEKISHDIITKHYNRKEEILMNFFFPPLFTNACGDFILMSRNKWFAINGNIETLPLPNLDMDGLVLYGAYINGAKEHILENTMIYKIEHNNMHTARIKTVEHKFGRWCQSKLYYFFPTKIANLLLGLFNYPKRRHTKFNFIYDSYYRSFGLRITYWYFIKKLFGNKICFFNINWGLANQQIKKTR